jgi:prephenate dehydratase
MAIAYLGPRGSFSEVAAITFDPHDEYLPYPSFPAVVAAVENNETDRGMLAIENSIEGAVSANIDLLIHDTDLKFCREIIVPVRHYLIAAPGARIEDITVVTSHPQPFGQCRKWLETFLPNAAHVAALSTSGAVEAVVSEGDRTKAAIGTERAAELYGGEILARDIHDVRANVTRFAVLAHHDGEPTGDDKTSLGFTVKRNLPGALHRVMSAFAYQGIQLTKAESRPTKAWLGDYVFLFDMEGHRLDPQVARAIEQARDGCDWLKVFGSYPRFPMESLRDFLEIDDPAASERMGITS